MTKQQIAEYAEYIETCEEFGIEPQLLEAHFVMGERQEREYKIWSKEQHLNGVCWPTRADFLLSSIKPQAMAAGAGR
jgi:hypothetical protein